MLILRSGYDQAKVSHPESPPIACSAGKAARLLEKCGERLIAVQTYMELMQGAKNKTQLAQTRRFLEDFNVRVIPLSAEIGNRAMSLVDGCGDCQCT